VASKGKRKNGRTVPARHLYQCKKCGYQFTAKAETLFNDSHLPLVKWFLAVVLITNAKKGMSSMQLQRDLKISYQTAWYVSHRLHEAMSHDQGIVDGVVELGETFHVGKYSPRGQRGKYEKQSIMGVMQRGTLTKISQVKAFPIPDRKGPTLTAVVRDHVSDFATIYTDEYGSYRSLNNTHYHEIVIHSRGVYVRGNVHTNTIEGF
jgi:transposase-like protein